MKIIILYIFLIFIVIIALFAIIALKNIGKVADGDYTKLSYYKNGRFVSPKSSIHTFKREVPNTNLAFLVSFLNQKMHQKISCRL